MSSLSPTFSLPDNSQEAPSTQQTDVNDRYTTGAPHYYVYVELKRIWLTTQLLGLEYWPTLHMERAYV